MNTKSLSLLGGIGLLAGTAWVVSVAMSGCVKQQAYQPVSSSAPPPAAAPDQAIVENDDYVYYPEYEIYYSNRRHQYGYREGNSWMWRPAPPRVGVDVLFRSPAVHMDFHDSPEHHHADVIRTYPHNWRPSGKDDQRDDHKDGDRRH